MSNKRDYYEVLGVARDASSGDIKKAYNVTASSFSKSAIEKIEEAGGKVIVE